MARLAPPPRTRAPRAATAQLDPRQRRTRAALYDALLRLLAHTPYRDITISDLAREAQVGRPTVYQHIDSLDDLLLLRIDEDLAEQRAVVARALAGRVGPGAARYSDEVYAQVAAFAFARVAHNRQLYTLILDGLAGGVAVARLQAQMAELDALMQTAPRRTADPTLRLLVSGFLSGGICALMAVWLAEGMPRSPEQMGRLFVDLVNGRAEALLAAPPAARPTRRPRAPRARA